ncbi:MAG: outer membrane protein assembly factor BamD [Acidobacteria bacterium]|nr:outer membrane protein assembly factor BamD [Acidobacteriota bacterium]
MAVSLLRRSSAFVALVLLTALASACASANGRRAVPPGTAQPDVFLYERGKEALDRKKWVTAREFFKQVTETYTQSPVRPDAKLGIGDTYLGEGSPEALVLAIAEFQEFLSFYPTHPRADYAQYKLGLAHFRQMRAPQRDQTETREAIRELETFVTRYPNSALLPEVQAKLRDAKDRLSEAEFEVGRFYWRIRWFPGAIDRLSTLIKSDPNYTGRDGAYYYLGESLVQVNRKAEALPIYEKLVAEFEQSEYLEQAKKRIDEIKAAQSIDAPQPPTPTATASAPRAGASGTPGAGPAPGTATVKTTQP